MPQKEIENHVTGVDFAADHANQFRPQVLFAARPGVSAANDFDQNNLSAAITFEICFDGHRRSIVRVSVEEFDQFWGCFAVIMLAEMFNGNGRYRVCAALLADFSGWSAVCGVTVQMA